VFSASANEYKDHYPHELPSGLPIRSALVIAYIESFLVGFGEQFREVIG